MLAGCHFYAMCVTSGAIAVALEFVRLHTTSAWYHGASQHAPESLALLTWRAPAQLYCLRISSSSEHTLLRFRGQVPAVPTAMAYDTALQNFLHCRKDLVTCLQETKLLSKSSHYATIRCNHHKGGFGKLVILVHYSAPFMVPDGDILPNDNMDVCSLFSPVVA